MPLSTSPDNGAQSLRRYIERCELDGVAPRPDYIKLMSKKRTTNLSPDNNLEYDLRSTDWILAKARASESYSQNLYAALCNNEFRKIEIVAILRDDRWSCSWRYAGGIIADMLGKGDYMDWYCSGIRGGVTQEDIAEMSHEHQARHQWYEENFVSESVVTDEIRADLLKLGWIVIDQADE